MLVSSITVQYTQGRINHLVGPTHSTTPGPYWKARRRRGREGWGGVSTVHTPTYYGSGERCISSWVGSGRSPGRKRILWNLKSKKHQDDKDFGNFKKTVIVKCQNDVVNHRLITIYCARQHIVYMRYMLSPVRLSIHLSHAGAFLAAAIWVGHICIGGWGDKNSGWYNARLSEWCNTVIWHQLRDATLWIQLLCNPATL